MEFSEFFLGVSASLVASFLWSMYQDYQSNPSSFTEKFVNKKDDDDFVNIKSRR